MISPLAMLAVQGLQEPAFERPARLDPRLSFPYSESLFRNVIVNVSLAQASAESARIFTIEAVNGTMAIDDETIDGVLSATNSMLDDEVEFKTLWDLRKCPIPTPNVVFRCLRWAMSRKRDLDTYNAAMAVVLPATRPTILQVVNSVLHVFAPRCPVRATADLENAREFLNSSEPAPRPQK